MATRKLNIPLLFGAHGGDVDKKHAPFGWLKTAKNLRVRERGRLGTRNGYAPAVMTTRNGTLVAFDLAEYRGRIIASGSDEGDGYATDIYEHPDNAVDRWRGTDPLGRRVTVNPFTNLREVAGIPQVDGGVDVLDAVVGLGAGGGSKSYVMLVYQPVDSSRTFALIVDAETDQVVHHENLSSGAFAVGNFTAVKAAYAGGRFYAVGFDSYGGTPIAIARYTVGLNQRFTSHAVVPGSSGGVQALDLVEVTNGTTARVALAFQREGEAIEIHVFDTSGNTLGSVITVAAPGSLHLSLEADQIDDSINLYAVEPGAVGTLRTFDFAGTLTAGPTSLPVGETGSIGRLRAQDGFYERIAVAVNQGSGAVRVEIIDIADHTVTHAITLDQVVVRSRLVSGQSAGQPVALVFSGLVAPNLPDLKAATNALFFVTADAVHMTSRDFVRGEDTQMVSLTRDALTGQLCWVCARDPGVDSLGVPVVTLLDFQSPARRQSSKYGGLLYRAGGTPSVYDGRMSGELGFQESPGIHSLSPGGGGELTPGGTYYYTVHWEFVLADGALMVSPVSAGGNSGQSVTQQAASITLGLDENAVTLVVTTPHSVRTALGDGLHGASVTAVVSRTAWNAAIEAPESVLRRAVTRRVPIGMNNYGEPIFIADEMSDATLSTQEPIYTQGDRGVLSGPLEQNSPRACSYITASESRLILAGLSRGFEFQMSRASFISEAFSFSEFSTFLGKVSAPIIAAQSLDTARLLFTASDIFAVFGDGPDDLGGGAIGDPLEVASSGGLREEGWRSLLKVPEGLFFQMSDDKLMLLPRGAQSPVWAGEALSALLSAFPAISGATRCRREHAAIFALSTASDARLAVLDFRVGEWLIDTPPLVAGSGIDAVVDSDEGLAYLSGGVVHIQTTGYADGASTPIDTEIETHPIYPFLPGGHGHAYNALFVGELRGECDLTLAVSLDEGLTFSTLTTHALTGAVGCTVKKNWTLPECVSGSYVFRLTKSGLVANAGVVFNDLTLLVEDEPGLENLSVESYG